MRFKISEALKYERAKEAFEKLSVEEISQKYNYPRPLAEALYEAVHSIEVDKVTMEQLFKEMDQCWK